MNPVTIAALGPLVAGAGWLGLSRWPLVRRAVSGALALASHAAAWVVLSSAYRGEPEVWRGLRPGLLGATVAVAAEVAILLAVVKADDRDRAEAPAAVAGLAACATAVVFASYTGSYLVHGLFIAVPTAAAALAALSGPGRRSDVAGLAGLAVADVLALVGLSLLFARTGSAVIARDPGLGIGSAMLLGAAAIKAGAVPGVGTWRLAASLGPGAPVTVGLRGQGILLAALGGPVIAGFPASEPLAWAAAGACLVAGAAAGLARSPAAVASRLVAAGAAVPFLALGLGGAVGGRAFLVAVPPFLVAAGAAALLAHAGERPGEPPRWSRWLGAAALVVVAGSLAGVPPGGGFPGTWLALSLGAARAETEALQAVLVGAAALGLALAAVASARLIRAVRIGRVAAVLGAAAAVVLVYAGARPVRLGIGWYLRVERSLDAPAVLPSAGAPALPGVGGGDLLGAALLGLVLVAAVVALGRGLRDEPARFDAPAAPSLRVPGLLVGPAAAVARTWARGRGWSEALGLGFGMALLLEAAALTMALRLMIEGARFGFL